MLVIIDLQEFYLPYLYKQETQFKSLLENLEKRIDRSKRECETIVNLTCDMEGITIPEVLEMISGYKKTFFLYKKGFDGSTQLHDFLQGRKEEIELAGIFMDVCLLQTWKSLKKMGYKVLPVSKDLTIKTRDNWRKVKSFPKGYTGECNE